MGSYIDGNTLLHWAAKMGMVDRIKKRLENGDNINAQNKLGQTPLHVAYKNGKIEFAISLLGHGAATDIRDNEGKIAFELDISKM